MKLGSSCPPPSTGVFPSSEDLGPEPASCSDGGPGLQGKKEKRRPLAPHLPRGLYFRLLALEPVLTYLAWKQEFRGYVFSKGLGVNFLY